MKANELMIGDWVRIKDLKDPIKRISCIDEYLGEVDFWDGEKLIGTSIINVLPIPLTAEILEKNGFTCDADGMNDSDELTVSIEYGEYQRNTDDGFKMLADGKIIKYVHELQHALRLCGIEKEIEL